MILRIFICLIMVLVFACGQPASEPIVKEQTDDFNLKTDIRMGTRFYTVYLNNQGKGYAVKGFGSDDNDDFTQIDSAQISPVFTIDSVYSVFRGIASLQRKPRLSKSGSGMCRVESIITGKKYMIVMG